MNRIEGVLLAVALCAFALVGCGGGTAPPSEDAETAAEPASETPEAAAEEPADITGESTDVVPDHPMVELATSVGNIRLELYPEKAPTTVENFLEYVNDGFFDGTIFHRVVPGFVIQGGGFTADMVEKETRAPIENEADNGLRNLRGTICMARTPDPHSATSQFFINTKDNPPLDFRDKSLRGWGYAVFGKVTEGMDVVEAIERVPTTRRDGYDDVPVDPIVIERARLLD
jgi:peptidyl-prolyl cis-trans isomerase B (cyclophilin B)